jgi:hypothetical protein
VADEFFSSVYPTVTAGQTTQVIIISTPNGLNMFYQFWKGAINKQNEYVPIDINWGQTPQFPGGPLRDDEWRKKTIQNTSEKQFQQEFECVSGDTFITLKNKEDNKIYKITIKDAFEWLV